MRSSRSASSLRAATSAVMSREIAEMPMSTCDPFRIGEKVTETSTRLSSFLTWVVLSRSTAPASRTFFNADWISSFRPDGQRKLA